ncbi:bifunctional metallophosphatase/5'-nucleotidase [Flavobacterium sp. UBA6031]|uniref:bifunctional metallophosphatase/5'-nucleotidase n=1 Tax=Flavobacterium sp. UBA6031 TaxID=1946551 RepID=UPI0025B9F544|nr:5'-nucleotidase C-terminal domain-containing protein [Flavobacterium sp. UBA6031]
MESKKLLTILQMNDTHAYFDIHEEMFWQGNHIEYRKAGGYARIATIVKQIRDESQGNCLFCDCGDTLHGTYPALATQGQAMIPILNSMGLDAMTAHWEFAYGPTVFKQRLTELNYPMLANNVYDKETKKPVFQPYVVKEIDGLRIGLIGIASNIVDKTMPPLYSEGIYFTLGNDELPPIIDLLRMKEKVDLIVLISHLGFTQDMKLLSEVQGVDICLSGHTHNRLYKPVVIGKTILIQSGCHGSFLGRLDLEIVDGQITVYKHQLIEVEAAILPDPIVAELVKQALAPYKNELAEIVGETATALNRGTTLETTMDNFLLQALLENTGSQLAFSNGWRYGAPIVPGLIILNDLYNMIPMNPPVSTVELSGAEIREMLEENLERTFSCDPYHQMGGYVKRCLGLNVYFKIENPSGNRIQKLFVGNEEIQANKYYSAAFVTMQGVPQKYGRNRENRSEYSIDVLRTYLSSHRPLYAELRGTFIAV